jgi:Histidine kinase-, DNA gyrase B-, and HSP90-like ATPase
MAKKETYSITLNLNILNHLGINLYSNIPAVLSEIVANAWDADADFVEIDIDDSKGIITVTDNGHGMSERDLNEKFLNVGYMRRENKEGTTPKYGRKVMGRKGIGKLSLFSIAETVEIHSVRGREKSALEMNLRDIKKAIQNKNTGTYHPVVVDKRKIKIRTGTRIILLDLRREVSKTPLFLRRRLARRFAIIGENDRFTVKVNGSPISVADRDYFKKLQYIWTFGSEAEVYAKSATKKDKHVHTGDGKIEWEGKEYTVKGWVGSFINSGDTRTTEGESLNNISVMMRGKLAKEDILSEFGDAGVYATYLIGEVEADFLDTDADEDIATSSRQDLIEDDPRYLALKRYVGKLLDKVRKDWADFKSEEGEKRARYNPAIDEWFKELGPDARTKAKSFFGKINQMAVDDEVKEKLFIHGVLAFESFRYKDKLSALDQISVNDLGALATIFADFDDIEANMYYQITKDRIGIIEALKEKLDDDARERALQEHIFTHLWLLDPMWERATDSPYMEKPVQKEFDAINAGLSSDERKARIDIKYKNTAGKHVIIELKRASVKISTEDISKQIKKYIKALEKCLSAAGRSNEPIEAVVILGTDPVDWQDKKDAESGRKQLEAIGARVIRYDKMLDQAYRSYEQYAEKHKEAGRLSKVLASLKND